MEKLAEQLQKGDMVEGPVTFMDVGSIPAKTVHSIALVMLGTIEVIRVEFVDGTFVHLPQTLTVTTIE